MWCFVLHLYNFSIHHFNHLNITQTAASLWQISVHLASWVHAWNTSKSTLLYSNSSAIAISITWKFLNVKIWLEQIWQIRGWLPNLLFPSIWYLTSLDNQVWIHKPAFVTNLYSARLSNNSITLEMVREFATKGHSFVGILTNFSHYHTMCL